MKFKIGDIVSFIDKMGKYNEGPITELYDQEVFDDDGDLFKAPWAIVRSKPFGDFESNCAVPVNALSIANFVIMDVGEVLDLMDPNRGDIESWPDWNEQSEFICGFLQSNNFDYYAFEKCDRWGADYKATRQAIDGGYNGVILENIS